MTDDVTVNQLRQNGLVKIVNVALKLNKTQKSVAPRRRNHKMSAIPETSSQVVGGAGNTFTSDQRCPHRQRLVPKMVSRKWAPPLPPKKIRQDLFDCSRGKRSSENAVTVLPR